MPALTSHHSGREEGVPAFIASAVEDTPGAIFGWKNWEGGGDNEEESEGEGQREGAKR